MNIAIKVEKLGKRYELLHKRGNKADSLVGAFANGLSSLFRPGSGDQTKEEFWALRDIDLEIVQGDRVGIIGRNGAGKSTLLKILSRIVKPTTGKIEFQGRMASLLEVGTGFHGDLSGRENIYLNGSILGMTRREIDSKFDEIVAFSEIEKFLDTPVKRYSSGMYVRLAFGVAAHLDPEILIVDEVLAVGDAMFQKKCLGKMREISGQGKTILFVSHNMAALQNLCNKGMVLKNGEVDLGITDTESAIKHYIRESVTLGRTRIGERTDREGEGLIRFSNITLLDNNKHEVSAVHSGEAVSFVVETDTKGEGLNNISMAITLYSEDGVEMITLANHIAGEAFARVKDNQKIVCTIQKFPLTKGDYVGNVSIYKDGILQDYVKEGFSLTVHEGDFYGTGRILPGNQASVLIDHSWSLQ